VISNPEFTPFSQDMLIGRTKNAAKGIFSFDLESGGLSFAKIISTHLQHSEEPAFPTEDERLARSRQMEILSAKALSVKDSCVIVTGDLNLCDEEYHASSWSPLFEKGAIYTDKTWDGDAFCAILTGKRISSALNLDHTMALKGSVLSLQTELVETGYNAELFKEKALSDHKGLLSTVTLH
jgi:endonuclease/exonuclease/phosphatase family metal-dependent hydrolase